MTERLSTPGTFAAAIARRYGEVPLMAPLVDMTVRLNRRLPTERISAFETHVQIAPRVTVNNSPAWMFRVDATGRPHGWLAGAPIVRRLADRQRRLEPDAPHGPADLHASRTARAGSIELPAATGPAVAQTAASPPPLPMIVCRRAGETPGQRTGKEQPYGGSPQPLERQASKAAHSDERRGGKAPAGIDLEQLTEKVVRAIDRRIVAYRERTARS